MPAGPAWVVAALLALAAGAAPARAEEAPADSLAPAVETTPAPEATPAAEAVTPAVPEAAPPAAAPARAVSNARLTGTRRVRLTEESHNVVRSGPGERFSIVGVFPGKTTFPVIAKSGDWFNVRLSDTETAWIHSSLCEEYDDLADLEWKPNPKLFTRTGSYILTGYAGAYAFEAANARHENGPSRSGGPV